MQAIANETIWTAACVTLLPLEGSCLVNCVPQFIAKQRLIENIPLQLINGTIKYSLYEQFSLRSMSYQKGICGSSQHIYLPFLGKNLLKTSPRQRRTLGGVAFYAARDISRNSGYKFFLELVFPSCIARQTSEVQRCPFSGLFSP
jgi:hypothetical protein